MIPAARRGVVPKAAAVFVLVLLLAPQPNSTRLRELVQAGLAAQAEGDYARAAEAFARAYERQPWNATLAFQVGQYELAAGQYEAALRHLTTTAQLGGWTPERHVLAGDAYFALNDVGDALIQWQAAARDRADDPNLQRRLGDAYEAGGRFAEAVVAWRVVAEAQPHDAAAQFRLGRLLAVTQPGAALAPLERAVSLDPSFADAVQPLVAAVREGQAQGDEAYLAANVGLVFFGQERYDLAEAAFGRAVSLNPQYGEAYAYWGMSQDRLGKDGGAALQQAVVLAPDSALAHIFLGIHYRAVGRPAQALAELTRAQELDRDNPALAVEIGRTHAALGDFELAEEWHKQAAALAPADPHYALMLAQFYVENEIELADSGYAAALRALALAPEDAAAHDTLGFNLVLRNQLDEGEQHLRKALALDPNLASAHYHLGVLLTARADRQGAEAEYRRTLALDPKGRYGNLALKALAVLATQ